LLHLAVKIIIIVIIVIFQGLGLLAYSSSELIFLKLINLFRHLVGLGQVISLMQGLYLHRTTQTQKNANTHPCLEWDLNPSPQCSSGLRQYMPQTTRPLGLAQSKSTSEMFPLSTVI
jgi:hypothetical protein